MVNDRIDYALIGDDDHQQPTSMGYNNNDSLLCLIDESWLIVVGNDRLEMVDQQEC